MNLFASSQIAWLRKFLATAEDNSISGSWLIDGSIDVEKLDLPTVYGTLDVRYVQKGIEGTHRAAFRDADDGLMYYWTFGGGGVLRTKTLVTE